MSSLGGSYSNISSVLKTPTMLEQLIEEINFQRAKEMRQLIKDGKINFPYELFSFYIFNFCQMQVSECREQHIGRICL